MSEKKTAKEFMKGCEHDGSYIPVSETERLMIKFANHHVKNALKSAANSVEEYRAWGDIDKIKNSYPLNKIK